MLSNIYDCVIFFNELDMLETRMEILGDVVDFFVVCESGETHSGEKKPYNFSENIHRFEKWMDQIIYVKIDSLPPDNSWYKERYHRSKITDGIALALDDDWIIVSDCDEIPDPDCVAALSSLHPEYRAAQFELQFYYYDLRHRVNQGWSVGAVKAKECRDANKIRANGCIPPYKTKKFLNGGWHFSYFGGANQIIKKMNAFMHYDDPGIKETPRDAVYIEKIIKDGVDLYGRDMPISVYPEELPQGLPPYVLDNIDRYKVLGWL